MICENLFLVLIIPDTLRSEVVMADGVDAAKLLDYGWKVFALVVGIAIMPLVGWVWSTSTRVSTLELENAYLREDVEVLEARAEQNRQATEAIGKIEKDIEYIKKAQDRIEGAVQ